MLAFMVSMLCHVRISSLIFSLLSESFAEITKGIWNGNMPLKDDGINDGRICQRNAAPFNGCAWSFDVVISGKFLLNLILNYSIIINNTQVRCQVTNKIHSMHLRNPQQLSCCGKVNMKLLLVHTLALYYYVIFSDYRLASLTWQQRQE